MKVPQKVKNRTTIQSRNSTSVNLSEDNENTNSKRYTHPYCLFGIIYNTQDTEATKCPRRDEWIKMMRYTGAHTHYTMSYLSAIKQNGNLPFATT